MVYDMRGPEKALLMRNTMSPVATEIPEYITRQERPPAERYAPGNQIVDPDKEVEDDQFETSGYNHVADSYQSGSYSLFFIIEVAMLPVSNEPFEHYEEKHDRSHPDDDLRGVFGQVSYAGNVYFSSSEPGFREN